MDTVVRLAVAALLLGASAPAQNLYFGPPSDPHVYAGDPREVYDATIWVDCMPVGAEWNWPKTNAFVAFGLGAYPTNRWPRIIIPNHSHPQIGRVQWLTVFSIVHIASAQQVTLRSKGPSICSGFVDMDVYAAFPIGYVPPAAIGLKLYVQAFIYDDRGFSWLTTPVTPPDSITIRQR